MKYRIINDKTNEVEWELFSWEEASELVDMEKESIIQVFECRECSNDADERRDAYGISTGYWCDPCYHSNKYPYRKDVYETVERHGYGERLEDNY